AAGPRLASRSFGWASPASSCARAMGDDVTVFENRPRTVAIIQARMGSTRFPGKVLRPIAGKPLLWHIVHRLRRCRMVDAIAIATSTSPRDEAIVDFCREQEIEIVRGPEDNVLARYVLAAAQTNADIVVRVSS